MEKAMLTTEPIKPKGEEDKQKKEAIEKFAKEQMAEQATEQKKAIEEYTKESERLIALYVPPHNKAARVVTTVDIPKIEKIGSDLIMLCTLPRGKYAGSAVAHTQVDDKDPLRFFVITNGLVVINPLIINHTKAYIFKEEGCMSFPDKDPVKMLPRYYKIVVEYQTLVKDKEGKTKLSPFTKGDLKGDSAQIFQHEVAHLNGHNVYDEDSDPKHAIGLGDGLLVTSAIWDKKKE